MSLAAVDTLASDVRGAEALRAKAHSGDPEALRAAAKQFEAMYIGQVLKTMRETRFSTDDDPFASSSSLKLYQEMFDQQIAQKMASGHGLGFADAMYAGLVRNAGGSLNPDGALEPNDSVRTGMPLHPQSRAMPLQPLMTASPGGAIRAENGQQVLDRLQPLANASPVSAANARQEFIDSLRPYAEAAAESLGIPANFILAQAALETGWGKRQIVTEDGSNSYNLFGIKAGSSWDGAVAEQMTTEYQQGLAVKKTQVFRAYSGYEAAFQDYADLLKRRYPQAAGASGDAMTFASGLAAGGYATDPAYAAKVQRVIAGLA
jgi:flagellar protein FlgJ